MATWTDIEKKLYKHARRACSAAAGKVRDELFEEATNAILDFYAHYAPEYYKRHYWNFKENSFIKYYSDHGGDSVIYGGIELTPQSLESIYQDSTQEVFDTVFAGFHGVAGMFYTPKSFSIIPPRMIPSPRQRLLNKQKAILKKKKYYQSYGRKVASREYPIFIK